MRLKRCITEIINTKREGMPIVSFSEAPYRYPQAPVLLLTAFSGEPRMLGAGPPYPQIIPTKFLHQSKAASIKYRILPCIMYTFCPDFWGENKDVHYTWEPALKCGCTLYMGSASCVAKYSNTVSSLVWAQLHAWNHHICFFLGRFLLINTKPQIGRLWENIKNRV